MDLHPDEGTAVPQRKRGAPKGNRNAWKHGQRSATAKAARELARRRILIRLPDVRVLRPSLDRAAAVHGGLVRAAEAAGVPPNKTKNSAARKRGAPKGNKNALKHGMKSAERHAFNSGLRQFLRRTHAMCALAGAIADAQGMR